MTDHPTDHPTGNPTGNPGRVIAIDGPAASGKGTLARRIAAEYGYAHLDSGALYRATAVVLAARGFSPDNPPGEDEAEAAARDIGPDALAHPDLRTEATGNLAGLIAAMPRVRQALVEYQRGFAANPPGGAPGAVIDGRDIGTVICPDAPAKIFIDASVETRATRRVKELREKGVETIHSRVLQDMKERDARDRGRAVAPLKAAEDALVLDTTDLDPDQVFAAALDFIALQNGSRG